MLPQLLRSVCEGSVGVCGLDLGFVGVLLRGLPGKHKVDPVGSRVSTPREPSAPFVSEMDEALD